MRGFLVGALTLIVLQVVVANTKATNAVGGLAVSAGNAVNWFLDPSTPAISDHSKNASTSSSTSPSSSPASSVVGAPPYTGIASVPAGSV